MTLKSVDQSWPGDGDHSPSPSSDLNETTEMLDLTQPMEEGDHASLSDNSDETVDGSQSARGDLPVLDLHVHEFLLGTEASGGRGDEPNQSAMPKLSFDNPQERVRWNVCQVETLAWWPELVKVPTPRDPISFAKWVWASF